LSAFGSELFAEGLIQPRFPVVIWNVNQSAIKGSVMAHTVFCVKLKREMPGLDEPPFDNDLGRKVYDNVSQEAWRMWTEHCKMLLNEYRLNPARREDQEVIVKQLEQFFFGEGSAVPKEYVPPAAK
jgi:Fe-S cluster biosynthesis and repair protein YggX